VRTLITLLALVAAVAEVAAAPPRVGRPADQLRLVFIDGDGGAPVRSGGRGDANLDLGRVVAGRCLPRSCRRTVVRRRFRLRIDGRSAAARFVRLRAFVQNDMPGTRVRVDGRLLTSAPQLIDPAAPLGVPVAHTVEIEVPASEPQGMLAQTIVWVVEDDR
jgi:hypothetical protein